MGSKRFKNHLCVYCCERQAVTGDHIFSRDFFLPTHREDLPQAPTCDECNNSKSQLEHYLPALLPFGGRHDHSKENLSSLVPKRLLKNRRLHRELDEGRLNVKVMESETESETLALPIREGTIESLFCSIIKGLTWFHWRVYLPKEYPVETIVLTKHGQSFFQETFFALRAKNRVLENLGDSTIIYEGIQGIDCPEVTIWRFRMYGGMVLAENSELTSTEIGGMSGPEKVMRK